MNSKFFRWNGFDVIKAAVVSALSTGSAALYAHLSTGVIPTGAQGKAIGLVAITSFIGYLAKNLFTNSSGTIGTEKK
jgi:hypothetical protein